MEIFIRKFNSKVIELTSSHDYDFSGFFPKGLKDAFQGLFENPDVKLTAEDYILCPIYERGDFQVGVTGTVQKDEKSIDAACRELGEEIGCIPIHESLMKEVGVHTNCKRQTVIYAIYLGQCISVPDHLDNVNVAKSIDDKTRRIGCFVFGSKKNVVNFLFQKKINRYYSDDKIVGIAAVTVGDICKHFEL